MLGRTRINILLCMCMIKVILLLINIYFPLNDKSNIILPQIVMYSIIIIDLFKIVMFFVEKKSYIIIGIYCSIIFINKNVLNMYSNYNEWLYYKELCVIFGMFQFFFNCYVMNLFDYSQISYRLDEKPSLKF
jgi:hypothetical protein